MNFKNALPNYVKEYYNGTLDTKQEAKVNYPLRNDELDSIYVSIAVLSELQSELIDKANDIQKALNPNVKTTKALAEYRISLSYFSETMIDILFMDRNIRSSNIYQELSNKIMYNVNKVIKKFRI